MTLQLRVGGVYRSRAGERVEIDDYDVMDKVYPFHGNNGEWYTKTGLEFKGKESPADLIAEWSDDTVKTDTDMTEIIKLQALVEKLEARVAKLEPKPTVKSVWWSLNAHNSCHWTQPPRPDSFSSSVFVVRHDTITAPDGSVTYAVEVEND